MLPNVVNVLSSARWQVTQNVTTKADEDDAVPGRIAATPFDLVVGNYKTFSGFDVSTSEWFVVTFVSNDGDVLTVLHLIAVGPIGITLAAARAEWEVRLLQFTEPLSDKRITVSPLTKVTCRSLGNGEDKHGRPQSPEEGLLHCLK